jgi:hypothetical protein
MLVREIKKPPLSWADERARARHGWAVPFHALEWMLDWTAFILSQWALLEVLEYLGVLSVLVAVIFYFSEAGDRTKQKHYQAWQVINTAQGRGGSGGRIEALQELNADRQPLIGVDAAGAFLQAIRLPGARLQRANLNACDLRDADFSSSDLEWANLDSANFRGADLTRANLGHARLEDADLVGAKLASADLREADCKNADFRNTDLKGIRWDKMQVEGANFYAVRNAPEGFVAWALAHGAVSVAGGDE